MTINSEVIKERNNEDSAESKESSNGDGDQERKYSCLC